ncbi:MAG: sigma 54-interacting transcriptional regulator [Clostridia bacterium]|nr:sigma 54-interacting transcriptional regulator [Clostridia bacterium]
MIESIHIPALMFNKNHDTVETNSAFHQLFDHEHLDKIMIHIHQTLTTKKNINVSYYSKIDLDDMDYLLAWIKVNPSSKYLITFESTDYLTPAIREFAVFKDLEEDFYHILEAMHDDFVIIDQQGVIQKVLPNFESMYGVSSKEAIGKTVQEMEKNKIFNPSVAIHVFKTKKPETMLQLTGAGKYLMCTAIPIKDENNEIIKIVSYTKDVTKYETLKEEYKKLENTLLIYSAELEQLRQDRQIFSSIIGNSQIMKHINQTADRISKFDANVLFTGESGVGKTMFAKLMHAQSTRKSGPFIEINCGAIPDTLLESELFGYEKGAFTGANKEGKLGLIELSNGGTLFLDEIGDLPLHMQVKLLKVIQEKRIMRIGSSEEMHVNFRLITATNKNLPEMVEQEKFREDLFYRLNVITIHVPSLKDRKEDIFTLCMHFVDQFNKKYNLNRALSNTVLDCLIEYQWPGNIRELENTIERLILTSEDYMITEEYLPAAIKRTGISQPNLSGDKPLKEILESVEKQVIVNAYQKHKTSIGVAKALGISQPSASLKINKYIK